MEAAATIERTHAPRLTDATYCGKCRSYNRTIKACIYFELHGIRPCPPGVGCTVRNTKRRTNDFVGVYDPAKHKQRAAAFEDQEIAEEAYNG